VETRLTRLYASRYRIIVDCSRLAFDSNRQRDDQLWLKMSHIVKRKGHKEIYDQRKLYASVYAACMSLRVQQQEAELLAEKVTAEINSFVAERAGVTSHELFLRTHEALERLSPEAAFMYRTHTDVS
jgi:transcriptional regulator NrdR family protein